MGCLLIIWIVLAVFVLTYGLLLFRKIGGRVIPVWVSMVVGAVLMVATLSISPLAALNAIDFRVIGFLFGMLVITAGFEKSGLINYMVLSILKRARSLAGVLFAVVIGSGFLSAFLVNDTVALLWTPIVLGIAAKIGLENKKALLIPLAFGITIGSIFTPIGNPQNVLVALNSGMNRPFTYFIEFLFVPSLICLAIVYLFSRLFFGKYLAELNFGNSLSRDELDSPRSAISDLRLAKESAIVLVALLIAFVIDEIFTSLQSDYVTISSLALAFGLLLLLISPKREYLLVSLNWGILVFFAGMFVVMAAIWQSGIGAIILSYLPSPQHGNPAQSTGAIILVSVILSQLLSNVPFVQLYTFQMHSLLFNSRDIIPWLALAAGSTLAGNLTLLGAVSNVIIIDTAERRGEESFSFFDFLKYGTLVTIVTALVFVAFLSFV